MDEISTGPLQQNLLELRTHSGAYVEGISRALVDLVVSALPDDGLVDAHGTRARNVLRGWLATSTSKIVSQKELLELATDLLEAVHDNPTKLGLVGRIPHGIPGKIVDEDELDRTFVDSYVSGIVVMSLALKRLDTLHRIGASVYAKPVARN